MKNTLYWILAVVITLGSYYYQKISGPTYPEKGVSGGIEYYFERSHSVSSGQMVQIPSDGPAYLYYRRFKSNDDWNRSKMISRDGKSTGYLPAQPASGKVEYYVTVENDKGNIRLPEDHNVITRYKGDVPNGILIPHIITIFLAMLFSVRTGIEALKKNASLKRLTVATIVTVILGGMIFGPLTQYYAFGALWTGVPFGYDLTDNKTLIALIGWLIAGYFVFKDKHAKGWVIAAALLMLIVFMIPHSVLGSELDYTKMR